MSRETIEEKARRLADADAVVITARTADVVFGSVAGDNAVYQTRISTGGAFLYCSCPAVVPECSHIKALRLHARRLPKPKEKPMTNHTPDDLLRPFPDSTDEPYLEVQAVDTNPTELEIEVGPEPVSVDPVTADPETGEIVVASSQTGEATLLPLSDPDRASSDLSVAPVTWRTLEVLSQTEFVPKDLRGRTGAILGAVLLGREYGLGPLEALRTIDVINGSPTPNAELLTRLYRRAGHTVEVHRADSQAVELTGTRADTGEQLSITYTLEDAAQAGLVTIDPEGRPRARSRNGSPMPWETYTADLLWARAVTRLVRRLAADALDHADAVQTETRDRVPAP